MMLTKKSLTATYKTTSSFNLILPETSNVQCSKALLIGVIRKRLQKCKTTKESISGSVTFPYPLMMFLLLYEAIDIDNVIIIDIIITMLLNNTNSNIKYK